MAKANRGLDVTTEELVAVLRRSSLPTVVTEGSDDIIVFRRLERLYAEVGLSVLPAGGRRRVLELFERRAEFSENVSVAFVADKDTWVLDGVPDEYSSQSLIFTWGYSIENDLYSDGSLEQMLSAAEAERFSGERDRFLQWYALTLSRLLSGVDVMISDHPNRLLKNDNYYAEQCDLGVDEEYPNELFDRLKGDYVRLVRGKSLMALLMRQLSYPARVVKHSYRSILELVAAANGPRLADLFGRVGALFEQEQA